MEFPFTFSCTWAQVQSKVHKMQKNLCFSLCFPYLVYFVTELEPKYIKGSIEMPLYEISYHHYCVKLFMLLTKKFLLKQIQQ
jgi:hypothetical protein